MKTLKRLDLKKCTELKSAEMKEILGGGVIELTCPIPAQGCSGPCGPINALKSCVMGEPEDVHCVCR